MNRLFCAEKGLHENGIFLLISSASWGHTEPQWLTLMTKMRFCCSFLLQDLRCNQAGFVQEQQDLELGLQHASSWWRCPSLREHSSAFFSSARLSLQSYTWKKIVLLTSQENMIWRCQGRKTRELQTVFPAGHVYRPFFQALMQKDRGQWGRICCYFTHWVGRLKLYGSLFFRFLSENESWCIARVRRPYCAVWELVSASFCSLDVLLW